MKRDYNNSFDKQFDRNHDGKIDWMEQYEEIDHLSGGTLHDEDREVAHDYVWRSDNPDPSMIRSFASHGCDNDRYSHSSLGEEDEDDDQQSSFGMLWVDTDSDGFGD